MNILITGGTGFVGSSLSKALLATGHEVTLIGRSEKSCARMASLGGVTCIAADTTQPGEWQKTVANQDALRAAVDHAIACGAHLADTQYGEGRYLTLVDPAGHPFCFVTE